MEIIDTIYGTSATFLFNGVHEVTEGAWTPFWGLVIAIAANAFWWIVRPVVSFIVRRIIRPIGRLIRRFGAWLAPFGRFLRKLLVVLVMAFMTGMGLWLILEVGTTSTVQNGVALAVGFGLLTVATLRLYFRGGDDRLEEMVEALETASDAAESFGDVAADGGGLIAQASAATARASSGQAGGSA